MSNPTKSWGAKCIPIAYHHLICGYWQELREVDDQIAKAEIELTDEVEMKLMEDERILHTNAWRTYREVLRA